MKKIIWVTWLFITLVIAGYFGKTLFFSEDKSDFLIGEATHGHFQIEMACETCHSSAFGGKEVLQDACTNCHAAELEEAHDSHPKKKFTDPREAYRIEILDARFCVSCHTEHQNEQTNAMGVTLPDDYCFHCHQETREERESHKDLPFDSCASAGCHNFHDNRALYESFLVENSNQSWLKEIAVLAETNANNNLKENPLDIESSAFAEKIALHPDISKHWAASSHAETGVDCGGCHIEKSDIGNDLWIEKPSLGQCSQCHENEAKGFSSGKHGMRLANKVSAKLNAITPAESKLKFHSESLEIQHGCNVCHQAHEFNVKTASVDSCLNCHADDHSSAYNNSPHAALLQKEISGELPIGSGVSCATCHMPRLTKIQNKKELVYVEHNQNFNLRPNEKMIRTVCMNCHGLEFSIDALADENLIRDNFKGRPGTHIESIDWSLKRERRN